MSNSITKTPEILWNEYLEREIPKVTAILNTYGITLLSEQPHIKGERFLMQALTTVSGRKLILLGTNSKTNEPVVIKAANDPTGVQELRHERTCRTLLHSMKFSYESFHSPKEILFTETRGYTIFVSAFLEQSSSFLERPLSEQFSFALRALKAQERTRATTAKHFAQITRVFGSRGSAEYLRMFTAFIHTTKEKGAPTKTINLLKQAESMLTAKKERIEQYCGFLTHTDFVPHNFRIVNDTLYLLDFSSLRFGNKHESWARFLNFMTLYNPKLETLLIEYVEKNRSFEERESLQLMRLFRLGEIITYYVNTLEKSSGNLLALNQRRIEFWSAVLEAELQNRRVTTVTVSLYQSARDTLRSQAEKERQIGLH
jgi:hypothetical protein